MAQTLLNDMMTRGPVGFDFSNCTRNLALDSLGVKPPKLHSTGTTIVAVIYQDGVVVGADTRATGGNIIMDKEILKVRKLTDTIYACGAGTAADLDQVCKMLSAQLRLLELNTGKKVRVATALRRAKLYLFKYMGYIGAYLLIGGVDSTGPHLYQCQASGKTMTRAYASSGSGGYAAGAVLERNFKFGMTLEEACELVQLALRAGMHGDNASGNMLNYTIINRDGAKLMGPIVPEFCMKPEPNDLDYRFKSGSTKVLKHKEIKYDVIESMDLS